MYCQNMNQTTYKYHVNGMHCQSCVLLTESELREVPYITIVEASLDDLSVSVSGNFGGKNAQEVADDLSGVLSKHGYQLSVEKEEAKSKWSDFKIAAPVALAFIFLFILLQKLCIVNLVNSESLGYATAFVIGIIASLSSCMAVVGGLVLSMSATFAKQGDKVKPQVMFHVGRVGAFFILGGVVGAIGSASAWSEGTAFASSLITFALSLIIGLTMLWMGVNLLGVFHFTKRFQPLMPKFLSRHAVGVTRFNHSLAPLLFGIATFFLPCGFTQSMQIYTLSTGSFLTGGLTMLAFALGTLPVLAAVSFSSLAIHKSSAAGVFFKSAGLIVIAFAVFNIINSLAAICIIKPVFGF